MHAKINMLPAGRECQAGKYDGLLIAVKPGRQSSFAPHLQLAQNASEAETG
jgi:hypothetical protein